MLRFSPPGQAGRLTPESPPLLSLTHFARPPFVSFGCVRIGASQSVQLLLHNPNHETATVRVLKQPEERGFSVHESESLLEPNETIPVTITWTPLEEGKVRELLTFIVNDIVKHQAVLLGWAELSSKKKKSLWKVPKKRNDPGDPRLTGPKQKETVFKNINSRTFRLPQKNVHGKCERERSPLHSCENLVLSKICVSPVQETRQSSENRAPTLQVSPLEAQDFTPGSLRRSKTYSILCTAEYTETTSNVQSDLHIEDEWAFSDKGIHNRYSVSPINLLHSSPHNVTCSPNIEQELIKFSALSPGEFCKAQLTIKTQTHTDLCTVETSSIYASSQECSSVTSTQSPICRPDSGLLTPQRKILSPNSYINSNSIPDEYLDAIKHTPIISPEQFVRENLLATSLIVKPSLSRPLKSTNFNCSKTSELLVAKEEAKPLQVSNGLENHKFSDESLEYREPINSRLTYCVKKKRQLIQPLTQVDNNKKDAKKTALLSATVTKSKAGDKIKSERPQLKSRRCILNTVSESQNTVQSCVLFQDLPVISVSNPSADESSGLVPGKSLICGRKRRSEEILSNVNIMVTSKEPVESTKMISPVVENVVIPAKKTHLSNSLVAHHVSTQRKKPVAEALKSSGKIKKEFSKAKFSAVKARPKGSGASSQLSAVSFKNSKRVVALPQSQLTFTRPLRTAIPRHPMPFAAKNMFYDERWIAKQERGFTWWLNFVLTPDDFAVKTDAIKVNAASLILGAENSHKMSMLKAPTKEEVSLKTYTARCRLNRLRRAACRLFTSESMVKAIRRLEVEIEAHRLLVRKDRHLWKDIGERQKVLNWLLSYNPLWLRIGLETIFGELISLESNSDVTGLALFIVNRLLWNPDIAAEYRHPTVPHLYRNGHEEVLSKFTLKKLLLLVFFLDHAKQSRLIDHDPCLFCKDSEFKTSKDILLAFSRDFLSGEGDLSRHLSYLGLPVSHSQTPLDEFDFAVTNLAVDLQCGVRLVRTMELLTQNWSLSEKLRVPAICRLQKMHNVDVVFQVLKDRGVQLKDEQGVSISTNDIVDRHRERTLALLWRIVFAFQVDVLLNVDHLKEEIEFLKQSYCTKKRLAALRSVLNPTIARKRDSDHFLPENYSERVLLLMEWVNAVCAFYSVKVENFTVSFSDGRVFCYLISHYHPSYVPPNAVCQRTTQTVECSEKGTVGLNSSSDSDSSLDTWPGMYEQGLSMSALCKELLENERINFRLVNAAVSDLGGIPSMIHHMDMSNTIPDEKIVITYLSFLCARLLDLRKEARAARVIQTAWRKYKLKVEERLLQKKQKAACIIQTAVVRFLSKRRLLKKECSAVIIQKTWRRFLAQKRVLALKAHRLRENQTSAVLRIQSLWRGYSSRKYHLKLRRYIILMQARVRMKIAMTSYKRVLCATTTLQAYLRSWLLAKNDRKRYIQLKSATLTIQSAFMQWRTKKVKRETNAVLMLQRVYRKWRARKVAAQTAAAIVIQSTYRMFKRRQRYLVTRHTIIKIQTWFRSNRDRKAFQTIKQNAVVLQKYYRAYKEGRIARMSYLQMRSAAVTIQAAYRGLRDRRFCSKIRAACVIQSFWRMQHQRKKYEHLKQLIVLMQSHVRRHQQLSKYRNMRNAACVIQSHYRSYIVTKQAVQAYKKTRRAAAVLQSAFRKWQGRRNELKCKTAIKIQSTYRASVARKRYLALKSAAVKIQSLIKMRYTCNRYLALRAAALVIQRRFRANKLMHQEKEAYKKLKGACVTLQAAVRGYKVRRQLTLQNSAATTIQAQYRMWVQKRRYMAVYKAVYLIQERYRAYREQIIQRQKFLLIKHSVIRLQAACRGYSVRKLLAKQHSAATCIQAVFRSHVAKCSFLQIKQSAVKIQRWYRLQKYGRKQRSNFIMTKRAVVVIQATYRGWVARKHFQIQHKAVVLIQSAFRKFAAQRKLNAMKKAALTIQQHYRAMRAGKRDRKNYHQLRESVRMIQAMWRGQVARKAMKRQHTAAALIQSFYRMHIHQAKYKALKEASEVIQKKYRALKAGRSQRTVYRTMKYAVIVLQSAYRGKIVRGQIHNLHKAASIIQAAYRSFRQRKQFLALKTATLTVQRCYRAVTCARLQRSEYKSLRNAAISFQSFYRGARVRREMKIMQGSAVIIQAWFRMHRVRVKYQAMRLAAVVIQLQYRAFLEGREVRKHYLDLKKASGILQAAWKGRTVRKHIKMMHEAATLIQSQYRMLKQKHKYDQLKLATRKIQLHYRASRERNRQMHQYRTIRNAVVCLQSAFRGMKIRQYLKAKLVAATLIQQKFKSFLERRKFIALRKAVLLIQQRFRMMVCAKHQRQQYLHLKKATVTIQAAYRGLKERRRIRHMHTSATVLQAAYRKHKASVAYRAMKLACIIIQRQYKAYKMATCERQWFLKKRSSAIIIQSAYRKLRDRQRLIKMHQAASKIQAIFRMNYCRYRYHKIQWAVFVIQQRYRANKQRDFELLRFSIMKDAACCIQAFYRGWRVRRTYERMNKAAIVIQRQFRTFLLHKYYLSLRRATVFIQRRYRATILTRFEHQEYLSLRRAVVCIQASYRGFKVRKELEWKHRMATKIQTVFRMHRERTQYQAMKLAARIIQQRYKLITKRRSSRAAYLKLQKSTVVIQAAFRGMRDRKNLRKMHTAAITIQSHYRMLRQQNCYKNLVAAARTVQRRCREKRARDSNLQQYQNIKKATILLQAAFRGMIARRQIRRIHEAAVLLQRYFKGFLERKKYLAFRTAAICIQRRYRTVRVSKSQRQEFLTLRKAAVCIQATYKGFKEREKMKQKHRAAARIQAAYRMHIVRVSYQGMKQAATLIQVWYRNSRRAKMDRQHYLEIYRASLVIQAFYRGTRSRKNSRAMHNAATVIQSHFRMYKQRKYYQDLCWAVRLTQQRFRANCARNKVMQEYMKIKKATLCIQVAFRTMKAVEAFKRNRAAQVIQATWKMHCCRKVFVRTKAAAVLVQATFRGHRARQICKIRQESACCIQKWYRSLRIASEQRTQYLTMRKAAVTLQSTFRGQLARKRAQKEQAARKLQSLLKMVLCRKKFLRLRASAIQLQSYYRMYMCQYLYKIQREAALILQRHYSSYKSMKHQRETYLKTRANIICVQATVRGFYVRRHLRKMEWSAIKIQAAWRRFIQRRRFLQFKASVLKIQHQYRAYCHQKRQRQEYLKLKATATMLQAVYRKSRARKHFLRERAACVIQRGFRCFRVRRDYVKLLDTVRFMQRHVRAKQQHSKFLEVRASAVRIQRWWREILIMRDVRQKYLQKRLSILKLQSAFRGYVVRREIFMKHQAACVIQTSYRQFHDRRSFLRWKSATLVLQTRFRALREGRQTRSLYIQERKAVIKIQAWARGWLVRNKIIQFNRKQHLLRFALAARYHLSAVIIQRRFRVHSALKRGEKHMNNVIYIQRWLRTRQQRRKFLADRQKIVIVQHAVRAWLQRRNEAACKIQRCIREFLLHRKQAKVIHRIVKIQALWRGYTWRKTHDTKAIVGLRLRLQKVNRESREHDKLYYRTALALEYLLTYKHLSYIIAALQHLEVATRLSSVCCERMAGSQAVKTIFILIRSCNRSIPCMEVIKLSVQVLLNLSKYEKTTQAVYEVECSVDVLLDLIQMYREKAGDKVSDKGGSIFTKTCCLLAILAQNSKRAREIRSIPKALDRIGSIYKLTCRKHKMDAERTLYKQRMSASGSIVLQSTPVRTRTVSRIMPDWILHKDNMREIMDPLKAIRMVMDTLGISG